MKAFNGSQEFKDQLLDLDQNHQEMDQYRKETFGYIENDGIFRGCSVGCLINDIDPNHDNSDHEFLAEKLGVPVFVTILQDAFFENLEDSSKWTEDLLTAIPVGADLTPVLPKFLKHVVELNPVDADWYRDVIAVLDEWVDVGKPDVVVAEAAEAAARAEARVTAVEWSKSAAARGVARAVARAAIAAASWSAKAAAAWSAAASWSARATSWAASRAAEAVSWSARAAAAGEAAEAWHAMSQEFLRLIRECE